MNINFTLVVQVVHFLIAYYIIDRLFLRPVVSILEQEKKDTETLQNHIYTEQKKLNYKRIDKERKWQQLRKQFAFNSPKIYERIIKPDVQEIPYTKEPDQKKVQGYVDSLKNEIVSKVEHV